MRYFMLYFKTIESNNRLPCVKTRAIVRPSIIIIKNVAGRLNNKNYRVILYLIRS